MKIQLPKVGDTRIKTNFLLFPKTIGYERRWLEVASWEDEFFTPWFYGADGYWKAVRWIN